MAGTNDSLDGSCNSIDDDECKIKNYSFTEDPGEILSSVTATALNTPLIHASKAHMMITNILPAVSQVMSKNSSHSTANLKNDLTASMPYHTTNHLDVTSSYYTNSNENAIAIPNYIPCSSTLHNNISPAVQINTDRIQTAYDTDYLAHDLSIRNSNPNMINRDARGHILFHTAAVASSVTDHNSGETTFDNISTSHQTHLLTYGSNGLRDRKNSINFLVDQSINDLQQSIPNQHVQLQSPQKQEANQQLTNEQSSQFKITSELSQNHSELQNRSPENCHLEHLEIRSEEVHYFTSESNPLKLLLNNDEIYHKIYDKKNVKKRVLKLKRILKNAEVKSQYEESHLLKFSLSPMEFINKIPTSRDIDHETDLHLKPNESDGKSNINVDSFQKWMNSTLNDKLRDERFLACLSLPIVFNYERMLLLDEFSISKKSAKDYIAPSLIYTINNVNPSTVNMTQDTHSYLTGLPISELFNQQALLNNNAPKQGSSKYSVDLEKTLSLEFNASETSKLYDDATPLELSKEANIPPVLVINPNSTASLELKEYRSSDLTLKSLDQLDFPIMNRKRPNFSDNDSRKRTRRTVPSFEDDGENNVSHSSPVAAESFSKDISSRGSGGRINTLKNSSIEGQEDKAQVPNDDAVIGVSTRSKNNDHQKKIDAEKIQKNQNFPKITLSFKNYNKQAKVLNSSSDNNISKANLVPQNRITSANIRISSGESSDIPKSISNQNGIEGAFREYYFYFEKRYMFKFPNVEQARCVSHLRSRFNGLSENNKQRLLDTIRADNIMYQKFLAYRLPLDLHQEIALSSTFEIDIRKEWDLYPVAEKCNLTEFVKKRCLQWNPNYQLLVQLEPVDLDKPLSLGHFNDNAFFSFYSQYFSARIKAGKDEAQIIDDLKERWNKLMETEKIVIVSVLQQI